MELSGELMGRCRLLDDHINTDQIIPTQYMLLTSISEMAGHAFENMDSDFIAEMKPGDIIVAGHNFGCGSAREQAPEVLRELKINAVVAKSFNATFFRNAVNIGLPVIVSKDLRDSVSGFDTLCINLESGTIENRSNGFISRFEPFPPFIKRIIECSGLVNYYFKYEKDN